MCIISKSNQGFRTRPSFQKIANKPNKEINYVVNPNQAVRDSYEFSNLINGEIDVEDEIKNKIDLRNKARADKDYKEADNIRDYLLDKGVLIEDKDGKTIWKFK